MTTGKVAILLAHALVGWGLCGGIMGVGLAVTSEENALMAHAIGAPVIAWAVSLVYFWKFAQVTPLQAAVVFVGFAIFMDATLVAGLIEKSYEMFRSPAGTWLPFTMMFLTTYTTGAWLGGRR